MWTRRDCLKFLAIGGGAFWLSGHAPYRQWVVYRAERLMIVASRHEPEAFQLVKAVIADLQRAIPDAKPTPARAPVLARVASLVATRQIEVAVMTAVQAKGMLRGEGEAAVEGPIPLRLIAFLRDGFVLASHTEFDANKAYLVAFGLFDGEGSAALAADVRSLAEITQRAAEMGIPLHAGAREFYLEREAGGVKGPGAPSPGSSEPEPIFSAPPG